MKSLSRFTYWLLTLALLVSYADTAKAQNNTFGFSTLQPFNAAQGQNPATQSLNVTTSTGNAVNFATNIAGDAQCASIVQIGNYSIAPTTVVPINVLSSSLGSGTYHCNITFSATGYQSAVVQLTVNVGAAASGALTVSPTSLNLSAQTNAAAVIANLNLTNSNSATPISYTATVSSNPSGWLTINGTSGTVTTTGTIQVQASPLNLPASATPYSGSITITPTNSSIPAVTVPVSFTVSANPSLQVTQAGNAVNTTNGIQFFYQTGTALPTSQTIHFASSNSAQNLQFTLTPSSTTSNFLVVTPNGSLNTPADVALQIASTAASLPANTYSGTLNVTAPGASNPSFSIPVSLQVSASPFLTYAANTAPPSAFNFTIGGTNPANQTLQIGTTSTALPITAAATMASGENWLTLNLSSPTASAAQPATLTFSVNPSGLAPGPHTATVTISSPGGANSLSFPVTLNVSAGSLLSATPSQLTFTFQTTQTTATPSQSVTVTSSGNPLDFTVTPSFGTGACATSNWIAVSQATGSTGTTGATFQVSVNPAGITAGQVCSGNITISSAGASNATPVVIPVTLEVSATALPTLSQSAFTFTAQQGTAPNTPQTLTITSTDPATPITFTIVSSATWLNISPTQGTTPQNVTISLNSQAATLPLGPTPTNLIINPTLPGGASAGGPITVPVTFIGTAAASVTPSAASLTFTQAANGPAPATQTINLTVTGAGAANANVFTATATSFGNWLSVTQSGPVPGALTVTVNGANLSPSTTPYTGTITINVPGASNTPLTIPVSLTVGPAQSITLGGVTNNALTFSGAVGGTNPANQTFTVSSTGGPINFTVAAASTSSACGNFLTATPGTGTTGSTPQQITVGANLTNVPAGTCTGTVTISAPGVTPQVVNVTFNVSAAATPQISFIENGASFALGAIAPGELISIFGSAIGPTTGVQFTPTAQGTMPTTVSNVQVFFDNTPAALYYVSATQINAIVPYEVAGKASTAVKVVYNGQSSNIIQQQVTTSAPAIFTTNTPTAGQGQGAIVNQNGTINSASNPATRGTVVAIYATGGGVPNPRPATAAITGSTPPFPSVLPFTTMTIGGQAAPLDYAGDAPFFTTGFLQINAHVPTNIGTGPQTVVLTINGNSDQFTQTVTIYVQ